MLEGSHILVVDDNEAERAGACQALQDQGAHVHCVNSRMEAVAAFIELTTHDIVPRAIVVDWLLNKPGTREHRFYKMVGRPLDNTARHLIDIVRKYDEKIAIIVYTKYDKDLPPHYADDNHLVIVPKAGTVEDLVDTVVDALVAANRLPDKTG